MAVYNRFDLLTSLSVDEEPSIELSSTDIDTAQTQQSPQQNIEKLSKNFWEIPDYVEKPIPCLLPITIEQQISKPVNKVKKSSSHVKKEKVVIDSSKDEEQPEKIEILPIVEVKNPSTTSSYYPPQPYKFKQNKSGKFYSIVIQFLFTC